MTGQIAVLLFFPLCLFANGELLGEHVCQEEITEPVEVITWELQNRTVRTYKWCLNVPPRCSEYGLKSINQTKITVMNTTRTVDVCCSGFHERNDYCVTSCDNCVNGLCLGSVCVCQLGWQGTHCDSRLSANDTKNIEDIFKETSYNAMEKENNASFSTSTIRSSFVTTPIENLSTAIYTTSTKSNTITTQKYLITSYSPTVTEIPDVSVLSASKKIIEMKSNEETTETFVDIDYRELGGQSMEISSTMPVDFSEIENVENPLTLTDFPAKEVAIERSPTLNTILTPRLSSEKETNYQFEFSANLVNEEIPQRRSSIEDRTLATPGSDTADISTGTNLIYSVCAASVTTALILVVVISYMALKRKRKRIDQGQQKRDVSTVAVYTTSIFHTPLPEPPSFENPTYITSRENHHWTKPMESIEFGNNVSQTLPNKDWKSGFKSYFYDHPPSTGSYRASSEVDALSQYSNARRHVSMTNLDPVYDEIPSREEYSIPRKNQIVLSHQKDNSICLYMNTCGTTQF